MKESSQNARILAHLQNGKTITPLEAFFWYKCLRLAARIADLRNMGYAISSEYTLFEGKHFVRYSMPQNARKGARRDKKTSN